MVRMGESCACVRGALGIKNISNRDNVLSSKDFSFSGVVRLGIG